MAAMLSHATESVFYLARVALGIALVAVAFLACFAAGKGFSFWRAYSKSAKKTEGLPGPRNKFPFGGAWALGEKKDSGVTSVFDTAEKYGKDGVCFIQMGPNPWAVVTRPSDMKVVWQACSHHGPAENNQYSSYEDGSMIYWLGREALVYVDADRNEKWKFLRRTLARSFLSMNVRKLRAPMSEVHDRFTEWLGSKVAEKCASKDAWVEMPMQEFCFALTLDVLGATSFSQNFGGLMTLDGGRRPELIESFMKLCEETENRGMQELVMKPWLRNRWLWLPTEGNRRFKHHYSVVCSNIRDLVEGRKAALAKGGEGQEFVDLLQTMLTAKDPETGRGLSAEQLRDNLILMVFAGFDTTATALTYIMYSLAQNPEVQKKLHQEIDEVLPNGAKPDDDTFVKLEYTRLVVKEALRLYAPVMLTIRCPPKDLKVGPEGKYTIAKDTVVILPLFASQRSETSYDKPLEFIPERHIADETGANRDRFFAFGPFAHGGRNCIGMRFAEMSAVLTTAALAQQFEFAPCDDYTLNIIPAAPMQRPEEPVRLMVRERTQQQ